MLYGICNLEIHQKKEQSSHDVVTINTWSAFKGEFTGATPDFLEDNPYVHSVAERSSNDDNAYKYRIDASFDSLSKTDFESLNQTAVD